MPDSDKFTDVFKIVNQGTPSNNPLRCMACMAVSLYKTLYSCRLLKENDTFTNKCNRYNHVDVPDGYSTPSITGNNGCPPPDSTRHCFGRIYWCNRYNSSPPFRSNAYWIKVICDKTYDVNIDENNFNPISMELKISGFGAECQRQRAIPHNSTIV